MQAGTSPTETAAASAPAGARALMGPFRALAARQRLFWGDSRLARSAATGILLYAASLVSNFFAGSYATRSMSGAIGDLLLDAVPAMDVGPVYDQGATLLW